MNMKLVVVVVCLVVCIGATQTVNAARDSTLSSAKDASAPAVDADAPAVDTDAPAVDTDAPAVDADAPAVDAPAPGPDTEESETFGQWAYEKITG